MCLGGNVQWLVRVQVVLVKSEICLGLILFLEYLGGGGDVFLYFIVLISLSLGIICLLDYDFDCI